MQLEKPCNAWAVKSIICKEGCGNVLKHPCISSKWNCVSLGQSACMVLNTVFHLNMRNYPSIKKLEKEKCAFITFHCVLFPSQMHQMLLHPGEMPLSHPA